jgi:hypothetical protein
MQSHHIPPHGYSLNHARIPAPQDINSLFLYTLHQVNKTNALIRLLLTGIPTPCDRISSPPYRLLTPFS